MKRYIRSAVNESRTSDFEIQDGVLLKYRGTAKNVVVPDGVSEIGDHAFFKYPDTSNLETIVLPESVTKINASAFSSCKNLRSVTLSDKIEQIGNYAFNRCTSLKHIDLKNVKIIGNCAFLGCVSLRELVIPESVSRIYGYAFSGCKNLTHVKVLCKIKIDPSIFADCDNLKTSNIQFISGSGFTNPYEEEHEDEYEDNQESEVTFHDWYFSDDSISQQNEFIWNLESKVRSEYDVAEWFEEPSTQGLMGVDNILVTLSSGDQYSFSFDFEDEQYTIYSDGPEAAANYYFNEIKEGIESGSALVEDTPTL